MKRISISLDELTSSRADHFDAIVVGSGYGGGVSALRLAMADFDVCVLERGREILPGDYPNSPQTGQAEVQITTSQNGTLTDNNGLFDLRVNEDMSVLVGCGLGGTSLINANVSLAPEPRVTADERWPSVFHAPETLEPYFEKARRELGAKPLPDRYYPNKLKALEVSAKGMGLKAERPPINVSFEDWEDPISGVMHKACTMCGDCCSGCNFGAKNTTLMNYLPRAHAYGATIVTEAGVTYLERKDDRWVVHIKNRHPSGKTEFTSLTADKVVLAAGALGSTEILMRSRKHGLSVSEQLGKRFSGNGDVLGFGFDAYWNNDAEEKGPQLPIYGVGAGANRPDVPQYQPGPCITGVIKVDMKEDDYTKGMVIEEGVAPGAIGLGMPMIMFMQQALHSDFTRFPDVQSRLEGAKAIGDLLAGTKKMDLSSLPYSGPTSQTQTFLVMSHDDSDGRLEMSAEYDFIYVNWPEVGEQENYHRVNKKLADASDSIWANYIPNPFWRPRYGRKLITVHPVGGCVMADTAEAGVVNDACQVFKGRGTDLHEGLYVCDGAVIPTSLGLNPLLTITAVSERAMDILVRNRPKRELAPLHIRMDRVSSMRAPGEVEGPGIGGKLREYIDMFAAWRSMINTGDYDGARAGIMEKAKSFLEPDAEHSGLHKSLLKTIKARIVELGLDLSLTKGELINDIEPALAYVGQVLERVVELLDEQDYLGIAKYLESECGDYSPSLAFSETMSGHVSEPLPEQREQSKGPRRVLSNPYKIAAKYGAAHNQEMIANFNIVADSLKKLAESDKHEAKLTGFIQCPFLGEGDHYIKGDGTFNCLIEQEGDVETWQMVYSCVIDVNGEPHYFHGFKTLARRPGSNWWSDLTTLSVDVYRGTRPAADRLRAKGVISLGVQDLLKQISTITSEFPDQRNNTIFTTLAADTILWGDLNNDLKDQKMRAKLLRKLVALLIMAGDTQITKLVAIHFMIKFGGFFGMLVFRAYGGMLAYLYNFPGHALEEGKIIPLPKPDGMPLRYKSEVQSVSHPIRTKSGVGLHLTRYDGRSNQRNTKKTLILAPGFATRAASFAMETVDRNLVDCLCAEGYDVWLFDYRSSPMLDATLDPFNLDDIAREDWPTAIEYIKHTAGVEDMQAIVHCMGSMTMLMSIALGTKGIRSAVCSQLTLHPVTNWFNKFKADTYMARMLRGGLPSNLLPVADALAPNKQVADLLRGIKTIHANSEIEPNPKEPERYIQDQVINLLTWEVPFPNDAPCYSPTCHRIFGLYGPVFAHEQLNEQTHNALQTVFGEISTSPFPHIAEIVRQGIAVDAEGENVYLKHEAFKLPLTFFAGALNQEFMPDTSLRTYQWLVERNRGHAHFYDREVVQDYAHMDFFLGKNADKDIYPKIIAALKAQDDLLR